MGSQKPKISVLVSARKNSKYLAKFLMGYFENTAKPEDLEILVCMNAGDTWNDELVRTYKDRVTFIREDMQLGRAGLHEYFNLLAESAMGDWLIYFCEDHFIPEPMFKDGRPQYWDMYFRQMLKDNDPEQVWIGVPKFDNCGSMNHIVSRGYYNALGGVVGRHGWIDSYINDMLAKIPKWRVILFDDETFHDFTHDHPNPMDDAHHQGVVSDAGKNLPKHGGGEYLSMVDIDADNLIKALQEAH